MRKACDFPKILLHRAPVDMRKQSIGLALIVENHLGLNPFDNVLYVFCNRRRDILKALYFAHSGFCLWTKRLDSSRFPWPKKDGISSLKVSAADFDLLIDGVNVFTRHKKLSFDSLD